MIRENNCIYWNEKDKDKILNEIEAVLTGGSLVAVLCEHKHEIQEKEIVLYVDKNLEILSYELDIISPLSARGKLTQFNLHDIFEKYQIIDWQEVEIQITFKNKE